jgi:hypothetical protein
MSGAYSQPRSLEKALREALQEKAVEEERSDDRNRTGVDGFAVRRKAALSAYLSGFRGCRVLSGALQNARAGRILGEWGSSNGGSGGYHGVTVGNQVTVATCP